MANNSFDELFIRSVEELRATKIEIRIVSDTYIKSFNTNTSFGFNKVNFDQNQEFVDAVILIDEAQPPEIKICTLFHEYGHVMHFMKLGIQEIRKRQVQSDFDWLVDSEFEAFKFQLTKIKDTNNLALLRHALTRLEMRSRNDRAEYMVALRRLMSDPLWMDCTNNLNKGNSGACIDQVIITKKLDNDTEEN